MISIVDKMREDRPKWFGYIMRREKLETIRTVMEINVENRRR